MNSEADFVAAIAASPNDELLYRAFGDWLEEQGDPRAVCIRSPEVRPWMGPAFEGPIPRLIESLRKLKNVVGVRRAAAKIGAAMVPELIELLKHEDARVRLQAVHCFRRMKKAAADAVPALVEALKDENSQVREQAAKAIKDCGAKKVTSTNNIREALTDDNYMVRSKAADILASMGARGEVLQQLAAQLEGPDATARLVAVESLGNLRNRAAVAPLCRALDDESPNVRRQAAHWLANLVGPGMTEAVGPLRAALRDRDGQVREWAAGALGAAGMSAAEAVPDLVRILKDRAAKVRMRAATALGQIAPGDDSALTALERATRDSDLEAAVEAAKSLGKWPILPERFGPVLLDLYARVSPVEGRSWWADEVVGVLGKLERPTPAVLDLLRRAVREDTSLYHHECGPYLALKELGTQASSSIPELFDAVRRGSGQAAEALGRMGEPGVARLIELLDESGEHVPLFAVRGLRVAGEGALPALPRLLAFLRAKNDPYKALYFLREVCTTIGEMGPAASEAIPDLLNQLNTNWGHSARQALSRLGPALVAHLPALVSALRSPERFHTYPAIAELLLWLTPHTTEVVEPLREALRAAAPVAGDHPHSDRVRCSQRTREIAARALSTIFLREVAPVALPELLPLLGDPSADVRRRAAEALGEIGSADAVDGLRAALRDGDEKVRALAAVSLGKIGDRSAAADLAAALKDASSRVRRESATALGKVRPNDARALAALRQAEQDGDKAVAREASAALKKIEGQKTKPASGR